MHSYIQYVHNLKGTTNFEKLDPKDRDVILSRYIRELLNQNELEQAIERESDTEVSGIYF